MLHETVRKGYVVEQERFNAEDVWEKLGITEHLGGIDATGRLIRRCLVRPGKVVLDIGCGTGYTACWLAKQYGLRVIAVDISEPVLKHARERIEAIGVSEQVTTVLADIHALDFPAELFDVVIAESVLVFCDKQRAASEVFRVLKPGGFFGANELSFRECPPPQWKMLLSSAYFGLDLQPQLGEEWLGFLEQAGFSDVSATISALSLRQQFVDHLRVDGGRKYLSAVARGLADPGVRATFFNRAMFGAWREYPRYIGYGLYVGHKPHAKREVRDRSYIHEAPQAVC